MVRAVVAIFAQDLIEFHRDLRYVQIRRTISKHLSRSATRLIPSESRISKNQTLEKYFFVFCGKLVLTFDCHHITHPALSICLSGTAYHHQRRLHLHQYLRVCRQAEGYYTCQFQRASHQRTCAWMIRSNGHGSPAVRAQGQSV